MSRIVLILGSAPNAVEAERWPRGAITDVVAINNAWRIRDDWDYLIHPEDFPPERRPERPDPAQRIVTSADYVPVQNHFGGFVYAGGTMAFTAAYWALGTLKPSVMAFFGCDMVYAASGKTHFYGAGTADPLREDVTLRSLEAKSARLMMFAAAEGCACVNLSKGESRLVFPRAELSALPQSPVCDPGLADRALAEEERLNYRVPSGKYWKEEARFDPAAIDAVDSLWLEAAAATPA